MPLGEISDLIDFYAASEGNVTLREKITNDTNYFPMGVK